MNESIIAETPVDRKTPPGGGGYAAWDRAAAYCTRLGLAYDRANETAAALRGAWHTSNDPADHAVWRHAADIADALFNDYAAADRAATRLLVPGLRG